MLDSGSRLDMNGGIIDMEGGDIQAVGDIEIDGALNHDGSTVGFYATTPIARQLMTTMAGTETLLQTIGKINSIIAALGTSGIGIFRHV